MLPTLVIKCFYRKLGTKTVELKQLHSMCNVLSKPFRHDAFRTADTKLWRHINTTSYIREKNKTANATDVSDKVANKGDVTNKVIKQSATGDIVVKTETDVDKVVTKVTIEKAAKEAAPSTPPPKPPGKANYIACRYL